MSKIHVLYAAPDGRNFTNVGDPTGSIDELKQQVKDYLFMDGETDDGSTSLRILTFQDGQQVGDTAVPESWRKESA